MKKVILFEHVTLDGFVAGPNGEMDWIVINQDMFDFVNERTSRSNSAMYGRKTWEMMEGYWPNAGKAPNASKHDIDHSAWYNKIDKFVLSNTIKSDASRKLNVIGKDLVKEVNEIKKMPGDEILVFGSPGAGHSLQQHDLIDGYWLFINPVILGKGTSLYSGVKDTKKFKLDNSHTFPNGVVCVSYSRA
jgi:dihydrofolate reductase